MTLIADVPGAQVCHGDEIPVIMLQLPHLMLPVIIKLYSHTEALCIASLQAELGPASVLGIDNWNH